MTGHDTIPQGLYAERRNTLMKALGSKAVAIFPTGGEVTRNADTHHRFRPDSDFYYLTGFVEPDSVLVLAPHRTGHQVILFVRPRDLIKEVWNGRRAGVEGAVNQFGADVAYPISELDMRLPGILEGAQTLHYRLGIHAELDRRVIAAVHGLRLAKRRLTPSPTSIHDPGVLLHEQRLIKSPEELHLMRRAGEISSEAHRMAMGHCRAGVWEYELEALIEYTFKRHGGGSPGYNCIVGTGENATILHYIENNCQLKDGELLLVDAGGEYGYYTADITRTFPVNGRFTSQQKDVYQIVLEAQLKAIDEVRPGRSVYAAHFTALRILTEGLVSLGLLKGSLEELLETEAFMPYYMHRTGHYLGLDVHDAGDYVRDAAFRPLEPGMVVTVEPGLYFGMGIPDEALSFKGIGVRIEDDVVCTDGEPEVLTASCPKTVEALEALVGTQR